MSLCDDCKRDDCPVMNREGVTACIMYQPADWPKSRGTTHGQLMQMQAAAEQGEAVSDEHHNPSHYKDKGIEPIDAIRSWLGDIAFVQYCRGQIIRYASRLGDKDESVKEARKLEVYARWMRETLEGKELSK